MADGIRFPRPEFRDPPPRHQENRNEQSPCKVHCLSASSCLGVFVVNRLIPERAFRNRNAFAITGRLKLIAAAAIIGLNSRPKAG